MALIDTDYKIDEVILYKEVSVTGNGVAYDIPHALGFTPLIYVQWSETPGFENPRELLQNFSDMYPNSEPWVIWSYALSNKIVIEYIDFGSFSKVLYFRIWCYPRKDININTPFSAGMSGLSDFLINSDVNYLKIFDENSVTVSQNSAVSIPHNLGYRPVVMIWVESDNAIGVPGSLAPLPFAMLTMGTGPSNSTPSVTTSNLILRGEQFASRKYYYKIYLDRIDG